MRVFTVTGDDFVFELAGLSGSLSFVLRADRKLVLLVARQLILLGDVLGGRAHVIALERIHQAVTQHRIDELHIAHLGAFAQMRDVRSLAHAFLTTGNDDLCAAQDLLRAKRHGPKTRATELVHTPSRCFHRNAGADRSLACRVLSGVGGQHLPHDHFRNVANRHIGALQGGLNSDFAQFVGGQA